MATKFKTIAEVRRANKAAGHHFFDRATMLAFKSLVESGLYGGQFFITSEDYGAGRVYRLRRVNEIGHVALVTNEPKINTFATLVEAREAAQYFTKRYWLATAWDSPRNDFRQ